MRGPVSFLLCAFAIACAGAEVAPAAPAGGSTAGGDGAARRSAASLVGAWAEYWSVAGAATTAQHLFAADGSWSWRAAPGDAATIAARGGRWAVEGDNLVLTIAVQEERAACPTGCEGGGAARRVAVDPPLVERLAIDACPPNDEARTLDASYECVSLGDRAFWRRSP